MMMQNPKEFDEKSLSQCSSKFKVDGALSILKEPSGPRAALL
jgi:hypothetical protein